jgi:hypothetical protein
MVRVAVLEHRVFCQLSASQGILLGIFPLNWAVKLETFRLNLRLNSFGVPY